MFDDFAAFLRIQDRSERTISGYLRDLRLFAGWFRSVNGEEPTPEAITPLDVREYRGYLLNVEKQAGSTINRKLAAVRAWLAWAVSEGEIEISPAQAIKGVRLEQPKPHWLTRKETYALLRELQKADQFAATKAGGNPQHPALVQAKRDTAVVSLLLHAGLRVGELVALRVSDVEVSERKGQVVVRYGKGGKRRTVPLNADARRAVGAWLDVRQSDGDCLFVGKGAESLSERGVQHLVNKYAKAAGLEECSPHTLRHSFGKALADAGVSLERIAELLGHENLETTRIYITPSKQDLVAAVEQIAWSD
jgi:site-specific recombinase XerD